MDTIFLAFVVAPIEMVIHPEGQFLYISDFQANSVMVINTRSKSLVKKIQVGTNPLGLAINDDGTMLYVVCNASNEVYVINTFDNNVISVINTGTHPDYVLLYSGKILVTSTDSNSLYVIDASSFSVKETVTISFSPKKLIEGIMGRIYVAAYGSNEICFLQKPICMVTRHIPVGSGPISMALDRERRKLFVANSLSHTVSVVNLFSEEVEKTLMVGKNPYGLALVK